VPLGPAGRWDWIALSSVGAVAWLLAELRRQRLDVRALQGTRLAALGGATIAALRRRGVRPDVARDTYVPGDVLAGFGAIAGARVLWPRGRGASSPIARALAGRGADLHEIEPFAAVPVEAADVPAEIDAIVLASSSAAAALADAGVVEHGTALVAAIGPETARTARGLGFDVGLVADTATPAGLVRALATELERAGRTRRTPVDA
jgi:uroporphyrinogen III methyltransferase/synthase